MRGKRAKKYRKLMHQYALTFGFREPYQVLVDAAMVLDSSRMRIDLAGYLGRTLQGKVKPMITQCSMRHLYTTRNQDAIQRAQTFERRRCNHHTLNEPLSTLECVKSVLDPKDSLTNKHRYVVASQEQSVRAHLRHVPGVPLVYISRSVMVMEPMANATEDVRDRMEADKFRAGLKTRSVPRVAASKRKRGPDSDEESNGEEEKKVAAQSEVAKRKKRGPSAPNPLSAKRPKKRAEQATPSKPDSPAREEPLPREHSKRNRKRKNKAERDTAASADPVNVTQEA